MQLSEESEIIVFFSEVKLYQFQLYLVLYKYYTKESGRAVNICKLLTRNSAQLEKSSFSLVNLTTKFGSGYEQTKLKPQLTLV